MVIDAHMHLLWMMDASYGSIHYQNAGVIRYNQRDPYPRTMLTTFSTPPA